MYENEHSEINRLKQFLLTSLPANLLLPSNSIAIRAAIAGLDQETCRLERQAERDSIHEDGDVPDAITSPKKEKPSIRKPEDDVSTHLPSRHRRGDMEGDLLPSGATPGVAPHPTGGGSQVGPHHPLFDRTVGEEDDDANHECGRPSFCVPGTNGGWEMRPRFDPFGPPGGPTEPRRWKGRGRGYPPGGFGVPNPDHMRPPKF